VGVLLLICVLALLTWLWWRYLDTKRRRERCPHLHTRFISLDDRGVRWNRHCDDCGHQVPYRVTIPARAHPDNPTCWKRPKELCDCGMSCAEDRSRNG
jgi:hypothetical protein